MCTTSFTSTTMIIRTGTEADYALLPELEARSDATYLSLPGFEALMGQPNITGATGPDTDPGAVLFMAETDAPIGFVYAHDLDDCSFIVQIAVVPEAQGLGAGSALLAALMDAARKAGKRGVTLTTYVNVPWNAPYYGRRGFRILDTAETGPGLRAYLAKDVARWSDFGERCAMGLFFA